MRLQRESNGQALQVDSGAPLGAGGEARVYAVRQDTRLIAKLYHTPTEEYARKLRAMLANPPKDPTAAQGELSIAWPIDLLQTADGSRRFVGFVMPRVSERHPIFTFYNPSARRQLCPLSNALYLHRTARNLSAAVRALHERGYVIGDVNESNILVSETALVTLVDTDSFQVRDPRSGHLYRCPVGKPDFTPPELQGIIFAESDRTPQHDRFGLAVLLFQLLMEGTHPFAGISQRQGDPPPYEERIRQGHFPYGSRPTPYLPMPSAPAWTLLHPTLRALFRQCFEDGHGNPSARPEASTWQEALREAEEALITCAVNSQHRYGSHLENCPWCERTRQLNGRDPFPSLEAVRAGKHLPARSKPRQAARKSPAPSVVPSPFSPSSSPSGSYSGYSGYSGSGRSVPVMNFSPNGWAWASLFLALSALLPVLRGLALFAIGCGVMGFVEAARKATGGRGIALLGTSVGLLLSLVLLFSLVFPGGTPAVRTASGFGGSISSVSFSPDGRTVAVGIRRAADVSATKGALILLDVASEQSNRLESYRGDVDAVAFSPDKVRLAVASKEPLGSGNLQVWNARTGGMMWDCQAHEGTIQAVAVSPDGREVASGGHRDYTRFKQVISEVNLWNAQNGAFLRTLEGRGEVNSVAFSPDGASLAAGSGAGTSSRATEPGRITVWDSRSGKERWTQTAHSTNTLSVAFSPDGLMLASGGNDSTVRLWEAATGKVVRSLAGSGLWVSAVAFSPDGRTIAGGGDDAQIHLWGTRTGRLNRTLSGHTGSIQSLSFAPDGKALASGSRDGTVKVWQLNASGASPP